MTAPRAGPVGRSADLEQLGLEQNRIEQFIDVLARQGGHVDEYRVSTPRLGH